MSMNVPGLVMMVLFYLLVLATGIWASFKSKRMQNSSQATEAEITLLGNRGINLVVGVFTMTGECGMNTNRQKSGHRKANTGNCLNA